LDDLGRQQLADWGESLSGSHDVDVAALSEPKIKGGKTTKSKREGEKTGEGFKNAPKWA